MAQEKGMCYREGCEIDPGISSMRSDLDALSICGTAMSFVPTIKDVASAAGLHFTTVSMALRGDPRLRRETRERVFAAVARVGYRRTEVSAALSRRRTASHVPVVAPRIAFLANRSPENGAEKLSYFRRIVKGAKDQAEALGYELDLLFVDQGHHDSASLYRHLTDNSIKGVILGAFEPNRSQVELPWNEFCVVKIDSRHMSPVATFVSNDQMHSIQLAFRKLSAHGYRRIGLAHGRNDEVGTDFLPKSGYLLEQAALPREQRVAPLYFPPEASDTDVMDILGPWIRQERVDAVISSWTTIRHLLKRSGYRTPDKMACACVCLSQRTPGLAGVIANLELVGREVTGLLAALLRAEQYGIPESPTSTYVQGTWIDGASAPARV